MIQKIICLLGLHKRLLLMTREFQGGLYVAKRCPHCGSTSIVWIDEFEEFPVNTAWAAERIFKDILRPKEQK